MERQDAERSVADWIGRVWDLFGIENEPGPGGAVVVRPGPHMLQEHFPELPEDGMTATFDRAAALAHEDRAFLTWEHPMVRGAMDLLTGSDLGASAITLVRDPRFKPATVLLEAVYIAECPAPPALEVGRFLPPTALRLVLDGAGRDLSALLPHEALRGECLTRNRKLATAVIRSQAARLTAMLERGEALAQAAAATATGRRPGADAEPPGGGAGPIAGPGRGQPPGPGRGDRPPRRPPGAAHPPPGPHPPASRCFAGDCDRVASAPRTEYHDSLTRTSEPKSCLTRCISQASARAPAETCGQTCTVSALSGHFAAQDTKGRPGATLLTN